MADPARPAVVLVEDNIGDIFLVQQAIAHHGLEVNLYVMNDGEEALAFFRQVEADGVSCPEVLLLDLNIPKVDGFGVLARLRASTGCRGIAAMILTSSGALSDREKSAALGVRHYFNKPSGYEEFLAVGGIIKQLLAQGK